MNNSSGEQFHSDGQAGEKGDEGEQVERSGQVCDCRADFEASCDLVTWEKDGVAFFLDWFEAWRLESHHLPDRDSATRTCQKRWARRGSGARWTWRWGNSEV